MRKSSSKTASPLFNTVIFVLMSIRCSPQGMGRIAKKRIEKKKRKEREKDRDREKHFKPTVQATQSINSSLIVFFISAVRNS